ncbi:MAG TPA: PilN domain-containing protein [Candidatus Paceibacterota bacterium]
MINLLPPSHKEELRGEEQFRLVLILGILLMTFFVCLSLSLLAIRVYVSGEIQAQKIFGEAQKKEGGESRLTQIRTLNKDISEVSSFLTGKVALSDIIAKISSAVPENVYLTSLSYTNKKIVLTGFAPLQEDLLQFRTNLEGDSLFKNFRFPFSNWSSAVNIDFSFDFEL